MKKNLSTLGLVLVLASIGIAQGPALGEMAPDFTLPDQDGVEHSLSDYRGQRVLLYFYLRDDTPGCTKEAKDLRDDYPGYQSASIAVLGVSFDSPASHVAFRDKYSLPFTLLSDQSKRVARLYGTQGSYPFATRRSFLINDNGEILHIIKDVDVTTHSKEVLNFFETGSAQL